MLICEKFTVTVQTRPFAEHSSVFTEYRRPAMTTTKIKINTEPNEE